MFDDCYFSSTIALKEYFSLEEIKSLSINKAFERYFRIGADDIKMIEEAGEVIEEK